MYSTGKIVILDSGFCILRTIIKLKKMGVYASAMIKKQRYWHKHVAGESIKGHMSMKQVGTCEWMPRILDGIEFNFYALKEPDYTLMMMNTYDSLIIKDGQRVSSIWDSIQMDASR